MEKTKLLIGRNLSNVRFRLHYSSIGDAMLILDGTDGADA